MSKLPETNKIKELLFSSSLVIRELRDKINNQKDKERELTRQRSIMSVKRRKQTFESLQEIDLQHKLKELE